MEKKRLNDEVQWAMCREANIQSYFCDNFTISPKLLVVSLLMMMANNTFIEAIHLYSSRPLWSV